MQYLLLSRTEKVLEQLVLLYVGGALKYLAVHQEDGTWIKAPDNFPLSDWREINGRERREITKEEAVMVLFEADTTLIDRVAAMISK